MTGTEIASAHRRKRPRPVRLAPADLLGLGLLGIRTRQVRAALSALGISIGIATLIVVTGIPASSQRALMAELSALGTDMLRAQPIPDQDPPVLLPEESPAMARRIGPVTSVRVVANTHAGVHRSDRVDPGDFSGISVLATRPGLLKAVNGRLRSGRFLGSSTERLPTVVLGSVAASRLGIPQVTGNQQIFVGGHWFTVIGILRQTPLSPDLDRAVFVDWQTARDTLKFDGHPTVIYVKARESQVEAVRDVLPATVGYASWHDWPPVVPAAAVLSGVGGAVVIGVVAGVYPSVRAARLTPTEALATV